MEGLNHLRKKMACYDIRQSDVFDGIESYSVTFSNGKDTSIAIYSPEGEIERTFEYYRDVRIPSPVMGKLIKEYLDWKVLGSKYLVSYSKTGALEETFRVKMKKEGNSIWVENNIVKN